ncbi:MAG: phytanoyl-CoA dioxygenase family protein [Chitinophagaceae bacterium]
MEQKAISGLKESFDRDGYVFIPGFLGKIDVDEINNKLAQCIEEKLPGMPEKHKIYEDRSDESTLKTLIDLQVYHSFFSEILNSDKFRQVAETLLEENAIGKTVEYFNKPPRIGKPTPPHQDNYYFNLKPPKAVTMWMALEEVDVENGCVRYIKGSHLKGLRTHGKTQTLGFSQGITDYEKDIAEEIAFPARPGDLIVHHALTIHRADGNISESRTRKALGLIYFSETAEIDTEAKNAYLKQIDVVSK